MLQYHVTNHLALAIIFVETTVLAAGIKSSSNQRRLRAAKGGRYIFDGSCGDEHPGGRGYDVCGGAEPPSAGYMGTALGKYARFNFPE